MDSRILIIKQLTGDISLEERNRLKDWLAESPEHVNIRNQIRSDWRLSKEAKEPIEIEGTDQFRAIQEKISELKRTKVKVIQEPKRMASKTSSINFSIWPWLLGLGIAVGGFFTYINWPEQEAPPKVERRLATMLGEVRSHVLPDDSKIWLNAKSQLAYIEAEPNEDQNIIFNGEGYFELASKNEQMSVVHFPKMQAKAKNASFNISEKEKVSSAQIHVKTGEVKLYNLKEDLIATVSAGQSGTYIYQEEKFELDAKFNPNTTSWKSDMLVFNEVPLEQVLLDIEHYFESKILLEKKELKTCLLTANYEKPDINRILSNLAGKYGMQLAQGVHGDYILREGACN